jgi:hypothetical protein
MRTPASDVTSTSSIRSNVAQKAVTTGDPVDDSAHSHFPGESTQ